jgi:hypothetical protein
MGLPQGEINRLAGDCVQAAVHGNSCEKLLQDIKLTDPTDRKCVKEAMVAISRRAHENPAMKLFAEIRVARDGSLHVSGATDPDSSGPQLSDSSSPLNPFRMAYNHYFPSYDKEVLK